MSKKEDAEQVIAPWVERDLSAAAWAGKLPPAFEVDDVVDQVGDALAAGRFPVLVGHPGVGRKSVVYELMRRASAAGEESIFRGKRVLQLSLQLRASALRKAYEEMRGEMFKLLEALRKKDDVIPFFSDIQLAYQFDLEPQLLSLAVSYPGPLLAAGQPPLWDELIEEEPQLEQRFLPIVLDEPSLERIERILAQWAAAAAENKERRFSAGALEQALNLSHRFISRGHQPRKVIDLLRRVAALCGDEEVTESHVFDHFCRSHRIPRFLVDTDIPLDLADLEERFRRSVLGQPEAIEAVVGRIGLIKSGLSDLERPFGVFLFAGPTGVGKTHLAMEVAARLFGHRDRMVRIDMAAFQGPNASAVLFGHPDARSLAQRRGVLTQRLAGHPLGVLLLDEFEKADFATRDRFMQLVDEGRFVNGAGESVSCRSMIIIATTNAGAEVYRGEAFGFTGADGSGSRLAAVQRRLEEHFRIEFLNRFDRVVCFQPLTREAIRTIALRELDLLKERGGLSQRQLALEIDETLLDWLVAHGYDPDYGARFLRRTLERTVTTALADVIVRENPKPGSSIALSVRANRVRAGLVPADAGEGGVTERVALPMGTVEEVRKLDWTSLLAEAASLLAASERRLAALEERKEERSRILTEMNAPAFWKDKASRAAVLDRFRELDVTIRAEERLAAPIARLREIPADRAETAGAMKRAAPIIAAAATALHDWEERCAEEGASAVWLVVSGADPLSPAGSWVEELARMELRWCRKLGLTADAVACELVDGELARAVIEVEGPGAGSYLAMEEGIHRRRSPGGAGGASERASVDIISRSGTTAVEWPDLRAARSRKAPLGIEAEARGTLEIEGRGLSIVFTGNGRQTLSRMLHDIDSAWRSAPMEQPDTARIYGEHGAGARDPRTGAHTARLKDVLQGDLNRFLEEWRRGGN